MKKCSLCNAEGVNKNTCPMNRSALCPNYEKHSCFGIKQKNNESIKAQSSNNNIPTNKKPQSKIQKKYYRTMRIKSSYNLTNDEMKSIQKYSDGSVKDLERWAEDLDYLKMNYSILESPVLLYVLYHVQTGLLHRNPKLKLDLFDPYIIRKYRYLTEDLLYSGILQGKKDI